MRTPNYGMRVFIQRTIVRQRVCSSVISSLGCRPFSAAAHNIHVTTARITKGLTSAVDVKIFQPPKPQLSSPVILNLPNAVPGQHETDGSRMLSVSAQAIVVQPDVSTTQSMTFPTSVHVTLAILDWISKNLTSTSQSLHGDGLPPFGISGQLLSGGLAVALALTECRLRHLRVGAVAAANPILDWTDVFPSTHSMRLHDLHTLTDDEAPPSDADPDDKLCYLRRATFSRAESFFDPFASPLLFFRTPSFSLPPGSLLDAEVTKRAALEEVFLPEGASPTSTPFNSPYPAEEITRKRTYRRGFPPLDSDLFFPRTRLVCTDTFPLKKQSYDLISAMRRSVYRPRTVGRWVQGIARDNGLTDGEMERVVEEGRFIVDEVDDVGTINGHEDAFGELILWRTESDWAEVGAWFGDVLRKRLI